MSTGRCVPPPVYIGIHLFVLPKRRPGQLSTVPWRARGTLVSWANRPVGPDLARPAPPRSALPSAAPPRPASGMSGFWIRQIVSIPRHALHEKVLHMQKGAGSLVSSQERRAAVVLLINRSSTGRHLIIVFLGSASIEFNMSVLSKQHPGRLFRSGGRDWRSPTDRTAPGRLAPLSLPPRPVCASSPRPVPHRVNPPLLACPAVPALPVECSGFGFDRIRNKFFVLRYSKTNMSNSKPEQPTNEEGQDTAGQGSAGRRGGAEQSRAERRPGHDQACSKS